MDWDISAAEKGGYEHFMFKEIMEQPEAIRKTIFPRIKDGRVVLDDVDLTRGAARGTSQVLHHRLRLLVSRGHGGQIHPGKAAAQAGGGGAGLRVPLLRPHCRRKDTLVIVISQSGETLDTMAALREAKRLGGADPGHRQRGGQLHRPGSG